MDFIEIKNLCFAKDIKNMKGQATNRKYLQIIFPKKDFYLEYVKDPQISTIRKQSNFKMDKRLE